jgi:RNA polymerase sigma-70 factor (ECF subfamily)
MWPPAQVEVCGTVAEMDRDPDLELLQAWRDGDQRAAKELLRRYYDVIRRRVITTVPERDVNDVVQEVVLALHNGRNDFRADSTFKAYVMGITKRRIADYYRRNSKMADPLGSSIVEHGAGPLTQLTEKHESRLLLEALRSVKLDDQMLLELFYWEKMTGPELAQIFEIKEAGIRSRLRRAKESLQQQIARLSAQDGELADTNTDHDEWARQLREELEPRFRKLERKKNGRE